MSQKEQDEKAIESIPSDQLIEMTAQLHRIFNAGGCNPMCHCCMTMLDVGVQFKLGTVSKSDGSYWSDDLKLKKLESEITDQDIWDAHNQIMRLYGYNDFGGKFHFSDFERLSYKEFISLSDRQKEKLVDRDLKEWNESKDSYNEKSQEVMLCSECSPEKYLQKRKDIIAGRIKEDSKPSQNSGCFRVNGKISLT